jgi:cbb3-type cytochrome oxidase subunit 3
MDQHFGPFITKDCHRKSFHLIVDHTRVSYETFMKVADDIGTLTFPFGRLHCDCRTSEGKPHSHHIVHYQSRAKSMTSYAPYSLKRNRSSQPVSKAFQRAHDRLGIPMQQHSYRFVALRDENHLVNVIVYILSDGKKGKCQHSNHSCDIPGFEHQPIGHRSSARAKGLRGQLQAVYPACFAQQMEFELRTTGQADPLAPPPAANVFTPAGNGGRRPCDIDWEALVAKNGTKRLSRTMPVVSSSSEDEDD